MTRSNSSVKMSPYEKGDGYIEREGTQRAMVLNRVEREGLTGEEAARLMGLSLRQVRRLLAAYRKEGVAALAHGNRGRAPVHGIREDTRKRVVALAQGRYQGLNHYQLQEVLVEREDLVLSRSSLWRILISAGVRPTNGLEWSFDLPSVETEALEYYRKLVSLIYREVGSIQPENRRELYQKSKIGLYPSIEQCYARNRAVQRGVTGEDTGEVRSWRAVSSRTRPN